MGANVRVTLDFFFLLWFYEKMRRGDIVGWICVFLFVYGQLLVICHLYVYEKESGLRR